MEKLQNEINEILKLNQQIEANTKQIAEQAEELLEYLKEFNKKYNC